jgi:hypothetical protein
MHWNSPISSDFTESLLFDIQPVILSRLCIGVPRWKKTTSRSFHASPSSVLHGRPLSLFAYSSSIFLVMTLPRNPFELQCTVSMSILPCVPIQNVYPTFSAFSVLFCTDCILRYFLIILFLIWSSLVQPLTVLKYLISIVLFTSLYLTAQVLLPTAKLPAL